MRTRVLGRCAPVVALAVLVLVAVAADARQSSPDDSPHLLSVPSDGAAATALARTGARVIARYEGFTVVEASGDDVARLRRAGADLRDDMREVRVGRSSIDPAREGASLAGKGRDPSGPGMAVVQFV